MVYCAGKLIENLKLFNNSFGSWFTSFSRVLPTSRVGYHAGKPIESVVYCLNISENPPRSEKIQTVQNNYGRSTNKKTSILIHFAFLPFSAISTVRSNHYRVILKFLTSCKRDRNDWAKISLASQHDWQKSEFILSHNFMLAPLYEYSGSYSPNGHSRRRSTLLTATFTKPHFSQLP